MNLKKSRAINVQEKKNYSMSCERFCESITKDYKF